MSNTNCLENHACPTCRHNEEIIVYASMWVSLQDDGTDSYADSTKNCGDVDYTGLSDARCPKCGYEGKLMEWWVDNQPTKQTT